MMGFLLRRLGYGFLTVLGVLFLLFVLFFAWRFPDEHHAGVQIALTPHDSRVGGHELGVRSVALVPGTKLIHRGLAIRGRGL